MYCILFCIQKPDRQHLIIERQMTGPASIKKSKRVPTTTTWIESVVRTAHNEVDEMKICWLGAETCSQWGEKQSNCRISNMLSVHSYYNSKYLSFVHRSGTISIFRDTGIMVVHSHVERWKACSGTLTICAFCRTYLSQRIRPSHHSRLSHLRFEHSRQEGMY